MEFPPWTKLITIDDLPNDELKYLADIIGFPKVLEILMTVEQNMMVYIPKNPFRETKEKYILEHYDGTKYTMLKLAKECNITERHIYNLLRKKLKKKPTI